MIFVFHHCGLSIISNMEFLYSWVTNLYICIAQLENTPIKSSLICTLALFQESKVGSTAVGEHQDENQSSGEVGGG